MLDLGIRNIFQKTLHIAQRGQPRQFVKPLVQMRQTGTLGRFLDPVEVRKVTWCVLVDQLLKESLLGAIESIEDGMKQTSIDQLAYTGSEQIQSTKGRKLTVFFDQGFNSDIDEVCWCIHDLDSLVDRLCGDMTDIFPLALDLELCSDSSIIAIQSAKNNI